MWQFVTDGEITNRVAKLVLEAFEAKKANKPFDAFVESKVVSYRARVVIDENMLFCYFENFENNQSVLMGSYDFTDQLIYYISDPYRLPANEIKKTNNVRNGLLVGIKEATGANLYVFREKISRHGRNGKVRSTLRFSVSFFNGQTLQQYKATKVHLNFIEVWAKIGGDIKVEEYVNKEVYNESAVS